MLDQGMKTFLDLVIQNNRSYSRLKGKDREQLELQLTKEIVDGTNQVVIQSLTPEQLQEYNRRSQSNQNAEAYVTQVVPNLPEKINKFMADFFKKHTGQSLG